MDSTKQKLFKLVIFSLNKSSKRFKTTSLLLNASNNKIDKQLVAKKFTTTVLSQYEDTVEEKLKRNGLSYSEKIVLGYSSEQLCDIVSDVSKYKEFLPFCTNSEILHEYHQANMLADKHFNLKTINKTNDLHSRRLGRYLNLDMNKRQIQLPRTFSARLEIGYPPIRESYISNVTAIRPRYVKAISKDTHLFAYLINEWKFQPYTISDNAKQDEACLLEFYVSFKFHSVLYATLSQMFMENVFHKMVSAFTDRAYLLYGKPSIMPIKMK